MNSIIQRLYKLSLFKRTTYTLRNGYIFVQLLEYFFLKYLIIGLIGIKAPMFIL